MKKLFYILAILITKFTFGQQRSLDSLNLAFKNAKQDTTRLRIRNEIGEAAAIFRVGYWDSLAIDSKKLKAKTIEANSLNNIGYIYVNHGNIEKALEYFHTCLKIGEEIGDKKATATSFNNLGAIYLNQGDSKKALEYFQKAFKIREEIGDKNGAAGSLINLGYIYRKQNELDKALDCFNRSLILREEMNDKRGTSTPLNNIGSIYDKKGDLKKALEYYYKSLKIREEVGDKMGIASSLNNIGSVYFSEDKFSDAFNFATKSMAVAKEFGFPQNIKNSATLLKTIFQKQNKYKEAFEMYELEIQMRDSLNNQETRKESIKKQLQYDFEKKEAIVDTEHKNELKNQELISEEKNRKQKLVTYFVIVGLLFVLIFSGFVYRTLRITRKQKLQIEQQKLIVEENQKDIIDSIMYARRIQSALLPTEKYIEKSLKRLKVN